MNTPLRTTEKKRLQDLESTGIMDTLPEPAYDDIATLASYICDAPVAYISFIDEKRQWYKSRINVPFSETSIDEALCSYTMHQTELVEVPDLTADNRFQDNSLVKSELGIKFYAGYPLINSEGSALGTLCVIDFKVRTLDDRQRFALEALGRQVVAQLELRRVLNESRHQALHDPLTELPNRLLITERLAQACRIATLKSEQCAVLFIDLDQFKNINDELGHEAGDLVLSSVAERLTGRMRANDLIGRYGGDEFVAILHGIRDIKDIEPLISTVKETIQKPIVFNGKSIVVRPSIGAALYPLHADTVDKLLRHADMAMYQNKSAYPEADYALFNPKHPAV